VENDDESNDDEYGDAGCWHGMAGRRQARQQVLQHDAHIDRSTMVVEHESNEGRAGATPCRRIIRGTVRAAGKQPAACAAAAAAADAAGLRCVASLPQPLLVLRYTGCCSTAIATSVERPAAGARGGAACLIWMP
jgi:hypothetical protein